jgi:hypothetical protein
MDHEITPIFFDISNLPTFLALAESVEDVGFFHGLLGAARVTIELLVDRTPSLHNGLGIASNVIEWVQLHLPSSCRHHIMERLILDSKNPIMGFGG